MKIWKKHRKKQKTQNMVIKEFNDKDESLIEKTNKEKMKLTENVEMLENELDDNLDKTIINS